MLIRQTPPGAGSHSAWLQSLLGPRTMRLLWLLLLLLAGCALHVPPQLQAPPQSLVVTSGGPNRSATFLAGVDDGILVIDLGW